MTEIRKIAYPVQVRTVDGVPHCSCCQRPMAQRDGGWMCSTGAAVLDVLATVAARLDQIVFDSLAVHAPPPALSPAGLADKIREYARQFPVHERTPGRLEAGVLVRQRLTELAAGAPRFPGLAPLPTLYGLPITAPDDIAPDAWRVIATDGTVLREGRIRWAPWQEE